LISFRVRINVHEDISEDGVTAFKELRVRTCSGMRDWRDDFFLLFHPHPYIHQCLSFRSCQNFAITMMTLQFQPLYSNPDAARPPLALIGLPFPHPQDLGQILEGEILYIHTLT